MKEDKEGFLVAQVDEDQCTQCGICADRCPQAFADKLSGGPAPAAYAAILKKPEELNQSASGGVFTALAEYTFSKGGAVFGCAYDDQRVARHTVANNANELTPMRRSKYVQSDTRNTFAQAKEYLESGRHVLYTGTPCQIAGLKSYLRREYENLITADVICHGVPSPRLFMQHLSWIERKKHIKLDNFVFRCKKLSGWGENYSYRYWDTKRKVPGEVLGRCYEDPYFFAFLSGASQRECCYACKYTSISREGDFTIADYWGIEHIHPEIPTTGGVSLLLVNTKEAADILAGLQTLDLTPSSVTYSLTYQTHLHSSTSRSKERDRVYKGYDRFAGQYMHSKAYFGAYARRVMPPGLKRALKYLLRSGPRAREHAKTLFFAGLLTGMHYLL